MPNVIQQLHPEGDTGTTIHPETEVAAITDLPTSAKSQLYAHYIRFYTNTPAKPTTPWCSGNIFFINSKSAAVNNLSDLLEQISGSFVINGTILNSSNYSSDIPNPGYLSIDRGYISDGDIQVDYSVISSDAKNPSTAAWGSATFTQIFGEDWSINNYCILADVPIVIGSNAG